MPSRKLTEKELKTKKVEKKTKEFMKAVRNFLSSKSGGSVPPEWECSLMLLEEYYKMFIDLTEEISKLDSMVIVGRYGEAPNALLGARDKAAIRLEAAMKSMGITFKEATKMETVEVTNPESPLEAFVKNKIEKRS